MFNKEYTESCDFIRKETGLSEVASLYELVYRFTEKYKELKQSTTKGEEQCQTKSTMPSQQLKSTKKRGRPRKQSAIEQTN